MGPTVPLLALRQKLAQRHPQDKFIWFGTPYGPERKPIENLGLPFIPITVAKMPRYLSIKWFTWPFDYLKAKRECRKALDEWRPCMIIGAGGFTQVPVMKLAAKRGIPCIIHQLDFLPLLSNRLVGKLCKLITSTYVYHHKKLLVPLWRFSLRQPVESMAIATPNRYYGIRPMEKFMCARHFGLDGAKPVVLVVGGGTGSRSLNALIENNLDRWLSKTQVLHLTGIGRGLDAVERPGYAKREFLDQDEMLKAYMAADIVITRAGMGAITDLATLSKPSIMIPMPSSPQVENAKRLRFSAICVEESPDLFAETFKHVSNLLKHPEDRQKLGMEIHRMIRTDDGSEWASLIERFLPEDIDDYSD